MESQFAVEVGDRRFEVPRAVEAEGGAAIQTYLEQQPGYRAPTVNQAPPVAADGGDA